MRVSPLRQRAVPAGEVKHDVGRTTCQRLTDRADDQTNLLFVDRLTADRATHLTLEVIRRLRTREHIVIECLVLRGCARHGELLG